MALPTPGAGLKRAAWKDPTVQAEFATWGARLGMTAPEMEERLWVVARRWVALRDQITAPFQPYANAVGTRQPWRMFVAPHRYPARLHVDLEVNGLWQPVYEARSDQHVWRRRQLDHDRMRAAIFRYGWPRYEKPLRQLTFWLARHAASDFPEATRLRTRMYKYRTRSPGEVRDGIPVQGKFIRMTSVDLARYR